MKKSIPFKIFLIIFFTCFYTTSFSFNTANKQESRASIPKYRPETSLLANDHHYIRQHEALNFWHLIPYYVPQQTNSSCSVAVVVAVVNAARVGLPFFVTDELATHNNILKRVNDPTWTEQVKEGGDGISLVKLKTVMAKSLKSFGVEDFTINLIYTENSSAQTKQKLHQYLLQSNKLNHLMVINFDQGVITNDISVGHFSPVAAYDPIKKRALLLDPDRQWFEPYWVPEDLLLKAMATKDSAGKSYRGYLWIRINNANQ